MELLEVSKLPKLVEFDMSKKLDKDSLLKSIGITRNVGKKDEEAHLSESDRKKLAESRALFSVEAVSLSFDWFKKSIVIL